MVDFNKESVEQLSKLCRIDLTEQEALDIAGSLNRVLEYVAQLQEVDVSHLIPYSHIEEQGVESLREDIAQESLSRDLFLNNSPDRVAGMVRVPPVIKQHV